MLLDNGHDLLTDGNNRVQARHGILEYGSDAAAANLLPVVGIFHLCTVDDGITVKNPVLFIDGAELYAERNHFKDLVEHLGVVQVLTDAHGKLKCLLQLVGKKDLILQRVSSDGEQDLVSNSLIALEYFLLQSELSAFLIGFRNLLPASDRKLLVLLFVRSPLCRICAILTATLCSQIIPFCRDLLQLCLQCVDLLIDLYHLCGIFRILLIQGPQMVGQVNDVLLCILDFCRIFCTFLV